MMRGTETESIMWLVCVCTLFVLTSAKPAANNKDDDGQSLQQVADDINWERQWWTPQQHDDSDNDAKVKESKVKVTQDDGWKAFKTEKGERRRWWEEDWHEDEWWLPKDSDSAASAPKTTATPRNKGGSETPSPSNSQSVAADNMQDNTVKQDISASQDNSGAEDKPASKDKASEAPHASPVKESSPMTGSLEQDSAGFILRDNRLGNPHNAPQHLMPEAESPREGLRKDDVILSPFQDPKPAPYSSRDEAPGSPQHWQYHQMPGFGKYIDHGQGGSKQDTAEDQGQQQNHDLNDARKVDQAPKQDEKQNDLKQIDGMMNDGSVGNQAAQEDKQEDEEDLSKEEGKEEDLSEEERKEKEFLKDRVEHIEEEIEEKERDRAPPVPEENRYKVLDQFYGFGLESGPKTSSTPPPPSTTSRSKSKSADMSNKMKSKENYNKGIIYDVVPGSPQMTHSVKKDLIHSNKALPHSDKALVQPTSINQQLHSQPLKPFDSQPASDQPVNEQPMDQMVNDQPQNDQPQKDDVDVPENASSLKSRSVLKAAISSLLLPAPHSVKKDLGQQESPDPTPSTPSPSPVTTTSPRKLSASQPVSQSAQLYIKSHPLTFCKVDAECRKGRECRGGLCVCLPSNGCQGHNKPVCGSDGKQYPSFCELHRTACVKHAHISVDHTARCFMKHANEMQKIEQENLRDHLVPTPSSDDGDDDANDDDGDDSQYEEDDYSYDDDDYMDKVDDVDQWLKENTKVTVDSSKIYHFSDDDNMDNGKKADNPAGNLGGSEQGGDYQSDGGYKECSREELQHFKMQLLQFHCKRFQEPDCQLEVKEERDYLTSLMFSYLDMNTDYQLSYEELKSRQKSENFAAVSAVCELTDLIWYQDTANADGALSLDEFQHAFNSLGQPSSPPSKSAPPVVHMIPTLATVGNGLELKCGLGASPSAVLWRRNGVNLRELANVTSEIMVLDDGSLFFSRMGVHHMGNYSCQDPSLPSSLQVHALRVQMPPIVKVSPHSQVDLPKLNAKMKCHAEGVPKPTITWTKNNQPISREAHHYSLEDHNEMLFVYNSESERDSGAYKCVAKNQAGTSEGVASVTIMKDDKNWELGTKTDSGVFMLFHKDGYTVYSPDDCLRSRAVHKDFGFFKFIPDSLDGPLRLCPQQSDCQWGSAVNVNNSFVYASQPSLNRVVVIETTKNWIPMQVISTDKHPVQLHYVEHLDQVWVLCWNSDGDDSAKTLVVIRDASKVLQHRAVHTQPVGNHFDQIQSLFIAPPNNLQHMFDFGYVTHAGQQGLTKLDLDNMRYVRSVDLSAYGCLPQSLAFVPIGGHVVVQCVSPLTHQPLQLLLDYVTDAVLSSSMLAGRPYVSPDSRHVVTVDDLTGKVNVAGVTNEGTVEAAYEVTVSASISDVGFFPAYGDGYMLVLTSADDDDIITINLSTGKVSKQKGTNSHHSSSDWHPMPVKRTITTGDVFCNYLLAPSRSSLAVVDVKFNMVVCENTEIPHSQTTLFIGH